MTSPADNSTHDDPDEWLELLSAYVDGEVTDDQRAEVERRIAEDPESRRTVEEFTSLCSALKSLPRQDVPNDLREAVLSSARQLAEQQLSEGAEPHRVASRLAQVGRSRRGWLWAAAAIAAAVMMMVSQPKDEIKFTAGASVDKLPPAEGAAPPEMRAAPELLAPADTPAMVPEDAPSHGDMSTATAEATRELAGRTAEEFEALSSNNNPVLVRVGLRREAFDNGLVRGVLRDNSIAVAPASLEMGSNFGSYDLRVPRNESGAAPKGGVDRLEDLALNSPSHASGRESKTAEEKGNASPTNSVAEKANAELVLIDAPIPQVVDAVSVLNRDYFNCTLLKVQPAFTPPQSKAYNYIQENAIRNRKVAQTLDVYSRSGVPRQTAGRRQSTKQQAQVAQGNLAQQSVAPPNAPAAKPSAPLGNAYYYKLPDDKLSKDQTRLFTQLNAFTDQAIRYSRGVVTSSRSTGRSSGKGGQKKNKSQATKSPAASAFTANRVPVVFFVHPAEPPAPAAEAVAPAVDPPAGP